MHVFKQLIKELEYQISSQQSEENTAPGCKYNQIIDLISHEVESLASLNRDEMIQQFSSLKRVYENALQADTSSPSDYISNDPSVPRVISAENMGKFGLDFLQWVDPRFVQDIDKNMDWYLNYYRESLQNPEMNEILLNVGYPSKKEREFLKHVEQAIQKKNDDKYLNILRMMSAKEAQGENIDVKMVQQIAT